MTKTLEVTDEKGNPYTPTKEEKERIVEDFIDEIERRYK